MRPPTEASHTAAATINDAALQESSLAGFVDLVSTFHLDSPFACDRRNLSGQ